ncbi:60S ribosomal protein L18a-like protein [Chenopodium quinoa]|uniref:60S ribosomal protein L18a-like protein n=1 Tax=Chenopodium quinoa TaxID=63459 RepID=UPI000B78F5D6|nr:60S ribosomal protein L18a-like protein [Chenopodium quinoa]
MPHSVMDKRQAKDVAEHGKTKYTLIKDVEDYQPGLYEKRLPCFGCGLGWFSFLFGFLFPPMWFYATILYFGNYYRKDPRERAGLAASAILALGCSVVVLIFLLIRLFWFASATTM